jgi:hypothetical protein
MRFEIGLATSLRFTGTPLAGELGREETTAIDFRGHCFVWHEIDEEHDPTLSIVLIGESPGGSAQRLLSALAWESNTAIASVVFGFHPSVEPFDPPRAKAPRSSHELTLRPRPRTVAVAPDPMLELALAHYRESLNAGSIFYRFLALWNTLDVVLGPGLDEFLRERPPRHGKRWSQTSTCPTTSPATSATPPAMQSPTPSETGQAGRRSTRTIRRTRADSCATGGFSRRSPALPSRLVGHAASPPPTSGPVKLSRERIRQLYAGR